MLEEKNFSNRKFYTEKTSEALDHFQIKTFGPYEKWEHTYDFSENGELVLDHSKSISKTITLYSNYNNFINPFVSIVTHSCLT